jgi:serine/threonine protein kinase
MPLSVGDKLDPYEIVGLIGAGGMGEVYRARDARLSLDVALKVLPGHLPSDPQAMARFDREAKAVAVSDYLNTGRRGLRLHRDQESIAVSPRSPVGICAATHS